MTRLPLTRRPRRLLKRENKEMMTNRFRQHSRFFKVLAVVCLMSLVTPSIGALQQSQATQKEALVKLNVLVTDSQNRPVSDVKQEEFAVFENGVPQPIAYFSREPRPLLYSLLIDVSGSQKKVISHVIEAAKAMIITNAQQDETSLIVFNEMSEKVVEFTDNKAQLLAALQALKDWPRNSIAIKDAVFLTVEEIVQYKLSEQNHLRAIILITDGDDKENYYKLEDLQKLLRKERVQIFAIAFDFKELEKSRDKWRIKRAKELLNSLAQETGGQAFFPASPEELKGIAQELLSRIRSQYVLGYQSTAEAGKNAYHKVNVTISDVSNGEKRLAITRAGFSPQGK
jgi:Ca-activated chloride channel homolog